MVELIEQRKPEPMTAFEMRREHDETGVSKTLGFREDGVMLEGIVFYDGTVAVHWCSEAWSVTFFPDWRTFVRVHIGSHPTNKTSIRFYKGRTGEVSEWFQQAPEAQSTQPEPDAVDRVLGALGVGNA